MKNKNENKNKNNVFMGIFFVLFLFLLFYVVLIYISHKKYNKTKKKAHNKIQNLMRARGINNNIYKDVKVLLCGMVRDEAKKVKKMRKTANYILSDFSPDSKILILENDSVDETRDELLGWASTDMRLSVLGCGINQEKCDLKTPKTINSYDMSLKRIDKMVMLRNEILSHVKSKEYDDFKYVFMFDFDLCGAEIVGTPNFIYEFEKNKDIEVQCVFGFNSCAYYDIYAHVDVGERWDSRKKDRYISKNKITYEVDAHVGNGLIRVNSCFGGLSAYRRSALINVEYCNYRTRLDDAESICEHVCMHSNMNTENIYVNTDVALFRNEPLSQLACHSGLTSLYYKLGYI